VPSQGLPLNWRDRLPDPAHYYGQRVEKLGRPNGQGWAQGRCPFHEDKDASISVLLSGGRGSWKCFAGCGAGDLVSFHERLTEKAFKEAVLDLVRGGL
jgi:DNA primase